MEITALILPTFVAGLLTFLAPCTLPMVPAYLGFISGTSAQEALETRDARLKYKIFFNGLSFVLGFSLVFVLFGVLAGYLGHLVPGYRLWLTRVGGVFVTLFGLFMLGVVRIPALSQDRHLVRTPMKTGGYVNAFGLGAAFGLGWTPCVGPVLGSVLLLAASAQSVGPGATLLGVFALGLSVPFLMVALALGTAERAIQRMTPYLSVVSKASGVLLLALGLVLVTNSMGQFIGYAYRLLSFFHYGALVQYF